MGLHLPFCFPAENKAIIQHFSCRNRAFWIGLRKFAESLYLQLFRELRMPHTSCCTWAHLYKWEHTPHTAWTKRKKRETSPLQHWASDRQPWGWEQRPSCCLRNSPIPPSFPSVLASSKVGLLHLQSPFLFYICCTFTKSLLLPVPPSSCLHCRGSSLAEFLPVQVCPPITGSGLDTANNTQGPNAIFVLYPWVVGWSADFRGHILPCQAQLEVPWSLAPGMEDRNTRDSLWH